MATATVLSEVGPGEFLSQLDVMLDIYASAMDADPSLLPGRRELMRRHCGYPAFRALHARAEPAGPVIGFAYGFHGQGGQWWYDAVWSALVQAAGLRPATRWLADCLEIAEIHIHKWHQRRGIGTTMLTSLTNGRTELTAVLSTPDTESTARRLYRRLGFCDLLTGYTFPGGSPPYVVMGAPLPLARSAGRGRPDRASPSIW
jgi:Acetyltransferase (GNAT) domain